MNCSIVILAAGKGTRMKSSLPKVLHQVAGKAMLQALIDNCALVKPDKIVVVISHYADLVMQSITAPAGVELDFVLQQDLTGTATAAQVGLSRITDGEQPVLIVYGDSPLLTSNSINKILTTLKPNNLSLFACEVPDPSGLGRLIIEQDQVVAIVESKDATPQQLLINKIFPGGFLALAKDFNSWLAKVDNNNAQQEYYLTDLVKLCNQANGKVTAITVDYQEMASANDLEQLAQLNKIYQAKLQSSLQQQGLKIIDSSRTIIEGEFSCGMDCIIEPNVTIKGKVTLGDRVIIKQGSIISDSTIGDDVVVDYYSIIEKSQVAQQAAIGPYARLRPNSIIMEAAKVGNFVETKNTTLGKASKASHLSYLGDAIIGERVNIGAGVITCNYDGVNKHQTLIADDAFVGSNCELVAPVDIGPGVTVAAGTTLTKSVAQGLVLSRVKQQHLVNWTRPVKVKK